MNAKPILLYKSSKMLTEVLSPRSRQVSPPMSYYRGPIAEVLHVSYECKPEKTARNARYTTAREGRQS